MARDRSIPESLHQLILRAETTEERTAFLEAWKAARNAVDHKLTQTDQETSQLRLLWSQYDGIMAGAEAVEQLRGEESLKDLIELAGGERPGARVTETSSPLPGVEEIGRASCRERV